MKNNQDPETIGKMLLGNKLPGEKLSETQDRLQQHTFGTPSKPLQARRESG